MYLGRDIAITKDGRLAGDTGGAPPTAAPPTPPRQPRRKLDPVMGSMAGNIEPPRTATGIPVNQFSPPQDTQPSDNGGNLGMSPSMPAANSDMASNETDSGMATSPMPAVTPTETPMPEVNPDGALPVSQGTQSGPIQIDGHRCCRQRC